MTRIQRLGSRWAIDFEMPPMAYVQAMKWIAALTAGEGDTVSIKIPQPFFDVGSPGTPLVNGGSQLGTSINIDGLSSTYKAHAGQWFNLTASSRSYLYQVAEDKTAASGVMAGLKFNPMIRRSPADNSAVNFAAPVIEGWLGGNDTSWTVDNAMWTGIKFTIEERE